MNSPSCNGCRHGVTTGHSCGKYDVPPRAVASNVDHPAHYGGDQPYEAIKVMEAWAEKWAQEGVPPSAVINLTQVLKYTNRHSVKGRPLEDLRKARWYLDRVIDAAAR